MSFCCAMLCMTKDGDFPPHFATYTLSLSPQPHPEHNSRLLCNPTSPPASPRTTSRTPSRSLASVHKSTTIVDVVKAGGLQRALHTCWCVQVTAQIGSRLRRTSNQVCGEDGRETTNAFMYRSRSRNPRTTHSPLLSPSSAFLTKQAPPGFGLTSYEGNDLMHPRCVCVLSAQYIILTTNRPPCSPLFKGNNYLIGLRRRFSGSRLGPPCSALLFLDFLLGLLCFFSASFYVAMRRYLGTNEYTRTELQPTQGRPR